MIDETESGKFFFAIVNDGGKIKTILCIEF